MKSPADRSHIPLAFLEAIWEEFGTLTWAADARPIEIRVLYMTAISNAVKKFYLKEGGEGAPLPSSSFTPSLNGASNE
jgi:hypothetical protein